MKDLSGIATLVLAGERSGPSPLLEAEGAVTKAEIGIDGRPMVDHVLQTIRESGLQTPCYMAGAHALTRERLAESARTGDIAHLPAAEGPAATVISSLSAIGRFPVLVTTCDHPLLTRDMVETFAQASLASGADLTIGLAEKATIEAAYPAVSRTYFPVGGRKVSGCNLFMATSPEALKAIRFWTEAEADRKRPARIARRFGLLNALRMLRPGVTLEQVFHILSRRLGCVVQPVILEHAEAAIDVDKPGDLALVREIMSGQLASR